MPYELIAAPRESAPGAPQ